VIAATVTQSFTNDTPYTLEAIYIFPLPSDAAVTDMHMRIGDRVIRSVVQEKEEARKTYEQARQQGKKAALLTSARPNVFTTSVANFLPGETVEITFTYTQAAALRRGVYALTFPMVVGHRYFPVEQPAQENGDPQADARDPGKVNPPVLHPALDPGHRLSIEAEIYGLPVSEIVSATHRIRVGPVENSDGGVRVTLADEATVPNADFNLEIRLEKTSVPALTFLRSGPEAPMHGLLTVFPPLELPPDSWTPPARDVVFLIDTSGSMGGESIGQAKAGLKRCLKRLRGVDRFTIVRFADDYSSFAPDLRPATPERIRAADGYVDTLEATGGTEMQKALRHVLDLLQGSPNLPMILFLTDGCVGNEARLLRLLAERLDRGRLFTFGIGSAPNEYLVRKMAAAGRGQCRFLRSHESIGAVMADFFETIETPVLTDVSVTWLDATGRALTDVECYPQPCGDVFFDRPLQVAAAFPSAPPARVEVRGSVNGEVRTFSCALDSGTRSHPQTARLFAQQQITELMCRIICAKSPADGADFRRQVVALALQHQLVTPYTARVAVEERIERAADGRLVTVAVPTPPPKGWTLFSATASTDPLWLLCGMALAAAGSLLLTVGRRRA